MSEKPVEKRGYQPPPENKPLSGGYQPSAKPIKNLVPPPPPNKKGGK